jgi:integrase
MREQHVVPLARQVAELLNELQPLTGDGPLLFPALRSSQRPISDNTLNAALRRMGYTSDQVVAHGFRSTASTLLNEQGWHPDLIELQLAHAERNKVRAAYNRAERLAERRKMMQAWADYLDGLKAGGEVSNAEKSMKPKERERRKRSAQSR